MDDAQRMEQVVVSLTDLDCWNAVVGSLELSVVSAHEPWWSHGGSVDDGGAG